MGLRGPKSSAALALLHAVRDEPASSKVLSGEPPRALGEHGNALWRSVVSDFALASPDAVELLAQCCGALDRAEACRERIDADGVVVETASGIKDHPLLKHELAAKAFIARTLLRLGLGER